MTSWDFFSKFISTTLSIFRFALLLFNNSGESNFKRWLIKNHKPIIIKLIEDEPWKSK